MLTNSDESFIYDRRPENEFRGASFSGYKYTETRKQLIHAMKMGDIDNACYWTAEIVCTGKFADFFDTSIMVFGKYIHTGNPKFVSLLFHLYTIYRNVVENKEVYSSIDLRNHITVRQITTDLAYMLSTEHKKSSIEIIKLTPRDKTDVSAILSKIRADHSEYQAGILYPAEPQELTIPVNELVYHLSQRHMYDSCYWIEWLLNYEAMCSSKKEKLELKNRIHYNVSHKSLTEMVWIIWDCIVRISDLLKDDFVSSVIRKTIELFCLDFKHGTVKKRKHLIYFAVAMICESYNKECNITRDKDIREKITNSVQSYYIEIKSREQRPINDYLSFDPDEEF